MGALARRTVRAGVAIFSEGEPADVAYVVERGEVEILVTQDGAPRSVALVRAGQLLGEMAILGVAPRSATAVAREDTELVVIERERLETRMATLDPVVRLALTGLIDRLRSQIRRGSDEPPPVSERADSAEALDALLLESELERALLRGELELWLQPIFDLHTRAVHGYEALCRWPHPTRGLVPPDVFIPLAERSGLIQALGRWMLFEACRVAVLLDQTPNALDVQGRGAFIGVNVSAEQFRDQGFPEALEAALASTGLAPSRLKLEITESALSNPELARRWMGACKARGARVSLDDFGTGYSSLATLQDLAIDEIKVDRRFVRQALLDPRSARIAEAILRLADGLGVETVCEGVETEAQLEHMRALGCRYGQGFLLARPGPWRRLLGPAGEAG